MVQNQLINASVNIKIDYSNLSTYDAIKNKIRPLDLIAFRGGDIISDLIATLESHEVGIGAFSHVGMVVTSEILPSCMVNGKEFYLAPDRVYVFESTFTYDIPHITDGVPDVTTGHGEFGVQLRDLEDVIPLKNIIYF